MTEDCGSRSNGPQPGSATELPASVDRVLDALANQRRRYTLHFLREHGNSLSLPDVADEVAVRENGTGIAEIPADEVKHVYLSLYHAHVPKLAGAGLVEYDQDQDRVALSEHAVRLEPVLEALTG